MGIVGPIGSGKSTILDGISFALYGRTPIVAQAVKSLINQRSDNSAVLLRFEVEGDLWEAVRSFRRKGQSQVALYRLESDEEEPNILERVVGKADVDARIEQLLGLDFDAFGRSVLLAQGKFAELLQAPPAERDKVLKGVFGHERISIMRAIARARAEESRSAVEPVSARVEQLEHVAARLDTTKGELIGVEERLQMFNKAEPRMAELTKAEADADQALDDRLQALARLERARTGLPAEDDSVKLIATAMSAADGRAAKAAALAEARSAFAEAEAEREKVHRRHPIEEATELYAASTQLEAARTRAQDRLAQAQTDHGAAVQSVETAESALVSATEEAEAASRDLSEADRDRDEAERAMHRAHRQDMARSLRDGLEAGHRCPVCHQEVAQVPAGGGGQDLAAASQRLEAARAARTAAEEERLRMANQRSRAAETLSAAQEALQAAENTRAASETDAREADREWESGRSRLAELLGPGDAAQLIEERKQRIAQADQAVVERRKTMDAAQEAFNEAVETDHRAGREVATMRVGLFELGSLLGTDLPPDDSLETLARWVAEVYPEYEKTVADATEERVRLADLRNQAQAAQADLQEELGVDDLVRAIGASEQEAKMLVETIATDEKELEAGQELIRELRQLQERGAVHEKLANDLRDARFVRYLLDEERARLAHLGSEHLQRLTSGRYRFTDVFEIEDLTSAEAVRRADSLSGGESFLASLALALALAEMVSRSGGRLDAFFLDEGFGALDSEHLDLAMEGLESLVAGSRHRLVVVVSHVPELRSRIEDLIELDRQPHTGDTIVVSGADR